MVLLPILNCVLGEKRCLCADRQSHILCEEKLQKRRSAGVSLMTVQPAELIHIWGKRATNCNSITLRWPATLGAINAGKFTHTSNLSFFTRANFLENKIYTEKRKFFCVKSVKKTPLFRVKTVQNANLLR